MLFYEDFQPGQAFEFGPTTVTEAEIVAFARQFDPQPFHVDAAAAAASPFGGLIASGWHTASLFMRMYVDAVLNDTASMGSPGVEELRWLAPLRPGELVSARLEVLETSPSSRRADRGTIVARGDLLDAAGGTLMTMRLRGFFARRSL